MYVIRSVSEARASFLMEGASNQDWFMSMNAPGASGPTGAPSRDCLSGILNI
jgi:hypothetical protein